MRISLHRSKRRNQQVLSSTILVIDDDAKVRESLEFAFPEYIFLGALSGEEGLKLLAAPNEIDLILLDMRMGGLSGGVVLEKIKQNHPEVGVIMLTAFGSKEVVVQALQGHADDFVDKPYSLTEIKNKIEKLLESRIAREKYAGGDGGSIKRAMRLIERNFKKNLSLQDISEITSLSPKYLSRKFKEETHINFTQFRVNLRIEQAKKMLLDTSFNINQIADRVGYENSESFMKIFKKMIGCTPTDYRQKKSNSPNSPRLKL